ncbi:Protein transport protein SFT2, partial [Rhizoctonia solani]
MQTLRLSRPADLRNLNGTARRGHKIESGKRALSDADASKCRHTHPGCLHSRHSIYHGQIMSNNDETAFRASLSQFRWARGNNDDSQQTQTAPNPNPFSRMYNSMSSYVPLRSDERSNEEEAYFALSRWERLLGFGACLLGAATCFFVAFLTLPWLALKPGKFALAFRHSWIPSRHVRVSGHHRTPASTGYSHPRRFCVLIGPVNQIKHLLSKDRLPFSAAYFGSLGLTLYFSLGSPSYFGALISAIVQIIALLSYIAAYFPGGTQTLRFGGQMALRGAGNLLPI